MDGDLLPCPRPGTDSTELVIAPQETASQAKGHLGQTPSHLEPPMLAEIPRMAQHRQWDRFLQSSEFYSPGRQEPWPGQVLGFREWWEEPDCQEAGPAIPRATARECDLCIIKTCSSGPWPGWLSG